LTQGKKGKKYNKNGFRIINEESVIKLLFSKKLEALRIIFPLDGELLKDVVKKVMEGLGVADGTAREHISKVLEANFFTQEENDRLYKNDELFNWLYFYFLPLYPIKEAECLETMLFNTSTKFNKMELAKTEVYTKRIEEAVKEEFGHEIEGKVLKNVVKTIWNVFGDEKIKTDLY